MFAQPSYSSWTEADEWNRAMTTCKVSAHVLPSLLKDLVWAVLGFLFHFLLPKLIKIDLSPPLKGNQLHEISW